MNAGARRLAQATTVVLALAAGAAVVRAETAYFQRVLPPAAAAPAKGARARALAARLEAARSAPGARTLTADQLDYLRRRAAREREGMALQGLMIPRGVEIDRSRFASRHPGWRPGPGMRRDASSPTGWRVSADAPPDTVHEAFIRIDFLADRGGSASTGDGKFDVSGPDPNAVPIDRAPHDYRFYKDHAEALKRYYETQSFGRVVLDIDVYPDSTEADSAYHLSDMADLGPWAFGNSVYRAAVSMFRQMFFAADSQSTLHGRRRIDWAKYDRFMMIHAGGDLQSDVRQDSKEDIPSFTVFLGDTDGVIFRDSLEWSRNRPIQVCSFVPETINQDGYYGALNGVIAHENGHNNFGFLDVYDIESGYPVCGFWSLMDSGNLLGALDSLGPDNIIYAIGLLPPSVDPLQRNWISDGMDIRVPTWGDTVRLAANEVGNQFMKVPLSSDEYLLLENRRQAPLNGPLPLDRDTVNKVLLGPVLMNGHDYDALEPGGGVLVWHVDESVVPFLTSLRVNPDYGLNSNPFRPGLKVVEADGLNDLGDTGSPWIEGSPTDPWQRSINAVLGDSTMPNLLPNQGTRPHLRLDFLDDTQDTMRVVARRSWALPAFPVRASFPPGGPAPLAIDAMGDGQQEICWAGGDTTLRVPADTLGLFAVRANGQGLTGPALRFATLDQRPLPQLAAVAMPTGPAGAALFAATTRFAGAGDAVGGRVHLVDATGAEQPGWPVTLPAHATTPPLITGTWPGIRILVGADDGGVYVLDRNGTTVASSLTGVLPIGANDPHLTGGVTGRLACWVGPASPSLGARPAAVGNTFTIAAGGADGQVGIFSYDGSGLLAPLAGWPRSVGPHGFAPDFLWLRFGGAGTNAENTCGADQPTLVVHHANQLWAYCPGGAALPGWGRAFGDTIVAGLGAGDPDGDGFPEVLVQTVHSAVFFLNRDGYPTPGWPRLSTDETLRTASPPLALDVDRDGRSEVVTLNGSGMLTALRTDGRTPEGWPLATGAGAAGTLVAADLDHDGLLDIVAPDRDSLLYAYGVPVIASSATTNAWPMLGGDPGRSFSLPLDRTPVVPDPVAGPLVHGSFKAFPNPARRQNVRLAYSLTEAADVEFRVLDVSGHEVASFSRHGQRSENLEIWDPGALPAGLYMVRARFAGARGSETAVVQVGLLR